MASLPPTEPPHWGVDETRGLLERVAGENASLPCPARGEVEPRVGLGKQGLAWVPGTSPPYMVTSLGYGWGLWNHNDNSIGWILPLGMPCPREVKQFT